MFASYNTPPLGETTQRGYSLLYDGLDRLTAAKYGEGTYLRWDRIPLIMLGLYGEIPQADLKKVKNESFSSGKDDIYENHFDHEGNLIKFYFPERGVSLELNN